MLSVPINPEWKTVGTSNVVEIFPAAHTTDGIIYFQGKKSMVNVPG